MNTNHTSPPWIAEKHPMGHYGIFQREHAHQIAEVFDRNTPAEMVEANANLIAAAPELLTWHREIAALATYDEDGAIAPIKPLSWETIARMALDYSRAAIAISKHEAKRGCAACDRADFQLGHADHCPLNHEKTK